MGKYASWLLPVPVPDRAVRVRELSDKRLEEVTPAQLDWLEDNVDLTAMELEQLGSERLLERFGQTPRKRRSGDPEWDVNDARLIRTLTWQYHLKVRAGQAAPVRGTLRGFWLTHVRPLWQALSLLRPDEGYEGDSERSRYLIRVLDEAFDAFVLEGIFRYQDLEVFDIRERYRLIGRELPRLIFYTDQEELFWLCRELSERFQVSAFCSGGPPTLVSCEWISRDLLRRQARNLRIAALTDFDPAGRESGLLLGQQLANSVFGFQSVQTTILTDPGLFSPHVLSVAAQPLRNERGLAAWLQAGGGIDGQPRGLRAALADPERVLARFQAWYDSNTRSGRREI